MQSAATTSSKLDHNKPNVADKETVALKFKTSGRLHKHTKTLQQSRGNCMRHQIWHHIVQIHQMPNGAETIWLL